MGIGYGQWTAGRYTVSADWSKKNNGGSWWTTKAQLDFMSKGDEGFVGILKDYALNTSDDVIENVVTFHKNWETSADPESAVVAVRGKNAREIWKCTKSKGMDGAKDESKINKISGGSSTGDRSNNSSSSVSGTVEDACVTTDDVSSDSGSIGKGGKTNGKEGQVIANVTYEEALEKYGKAITLPKFKEPDQSTSPLNEIYQGQCTELTWAHTSQLYDGNQSTIGDGGYAWESYKSTGTRITNKSIVGYGLSTSDGRLWAVGGAGHTGVVIAVFEDGSFLYANPNAPPTQASIRRVSVTLTDGVDGSDNVHFLSGVGKAKFEIEK